MLNRIVSLVAAGLLALGLTACDPPSTPGAQQTSAPTGPVFRVLAGSELKDIAPLVTDFGTRNGVTVQFDYTGSLDAVDRLSDTHNYDAVWVSHGKYLQLVPGVKSQIKASEKTMYSRVVLGVRTPVAKRLGWASGKTSWEDVIKAAQAGKFRFAMTNPTASNTGFVALIGLAAELSGKGDALEEKDIPVEKLKAFFASQSMTSGSSGTLADQFAAHPDAADGLINYESVIRTLNARNGQDLTVIVPKEGVITADYPLMLLSGSKQAAFYQKLVDFLRAPQTQKTIAETTFRTPLEGAASDDVVNELPFPGTQAVVDAILRGFGDVYSKPASSFFVMDVSGSMAGDRINAVQASMNRLVTGDGSLSGRFATFRAREELRITPFNHRVQPSRLFALTENAESNQVVLAQVSQFVNGMRADGGTAIYDALATTYRDAQVRAKGGERTVSIVLLTDGENQDGMTRDDFLQFVAAAGEPRVPIYTIAYGEADLDDLGAVAKATGGTLFDARTVQLSRVMKQIRAYQ
jgi:Ca-activated chloride channel family protein